MNLNQTISTGQTTPTTTSTTSTTQTNKRNRTTTTTSTSAVGQLVEPAKKKQKARGVGWRIRTKQLFLTYPQCGATKECTLDKIKELFGDNLVWAVVAEEDHKDGTPHLHAAIQLEDAIQWSGKKGMAKLDGLTGKHGDYLVAKNMVNVLNYVVKSGVFQAWNINVGAYLKAAAKKKSTKATLIAARLETGTIKDCKEIDQGFVMLHLRKLKEYQEWLSLEKQRQGLLSAGSYRFESRILDRGSARIAGWLQENLFEARDFKQKQLFIWGLPNMGKTSLINDLRTIGVRIYYMPYEDFYDAWDDECYDLIVLDEFKGQKRIQDLNLWLDGSHFPVRRKGTAPYLKRKNLPFIIISNYELDSCYKVGEQRLAPLKARLKQVEVKQFIEIDCVKVDTNTDTDTDTAAAASQDTIPIDLLVDDDRESISLGSQDTDDDE